jgi:hypothetical protein
MSAEPDQENPNPIFVTANTTKQMNYRVAEYLLCPRCEDRLNRGGETWTLKNSYRGGTVFPLRVALQGGSTLCELTQARIVDARVLPHVDVPKLVYFASSIFWRASARQWWAIDHPAQLDFGPYETRFRQFLLGEKPFPEKASLIINVSGNAAPHIGAIYPYGGGRVEGTRQYRFAIPGMAFWLHLGQIPDVMRAVCAYHSGVLCLAPDLNEMDVRDMGALIANSGRALNRRVPT